jgi:hypothetical protein
MEKSFGNTATPVGTPEGFFGELRHRLASKDGIAHARKRLAERIGEIARGRGGEAPGGVRGLD